MNVQRPFFRLSKYRSSSLCLLLSVIVSTAGCASYFTASHWAREKAAEELNRKHTPPPETNPSSPRSPRPSKIPLAQNTAQKKRGSGFEIPNDSLVLRPLDQYYKFAQAPSFVAPVMDGNYLVLGFDGTGLHLVSLKTMKETAHYPVQGAFRFFAADHHVALYQVEDDKVKVLALPEFKILKTMLSPCTGPIVGMTIGTGGKHVLGLISENSSSRGRYTEIDLNSFEVTKFEKTFQISPHANREALPIGGISSHQLGPPVFFNRRLYQMVLLNSDNDFRSKYFEGAITRSGYCFGSGSISLLPTFTKLSHELNNRVRPSTYGNIFLSFPDNDFSDVRPFELWPAKFEKTMSSQEICQVYFDWRGVPVDPLNSYLGILFMPEKNLLVFFMEEGVFTFPIQPKIIQKLLDEKDLLVLSGPWQKVEPGETFQYQFPIWSGSNVTSWEILAGPKNMGISRKGILKWKVPENHEHGGAVLLRIKNQAGGETYFQFRI